MKWILFSILPILLIAYVLQFYVFNDCKTQMILFDVSRQATILLMSIYIYKNSATIKDNLMALGLIIFASFELLCELRGGVIRGDISEVLWVILIVLGVGWGIIIKTKT